MRVKKKMLVFCWGTAGGARPFTGHLHLMAGGGGGGGGGLPHIKLAALADEHGPVFTIRLGVHRAMVVSSSDLAKELFTAFDAAISSRPKLRGAKHLGRDFATFGFSPYSAYWKELRKIVSVELLSNRRIELLRKVRVSEIDESVKELYKLCERKKDQVYNSGGGGVLVDMKEWFGNLNLNVVLRMVAGKRFNGDAEETRRCLVVMRDFFRLAGTFVPADALPYLGWMDLGGREKKMKETAKELDEIVGGWLAEHREKEYSGDDDDRDFMDVMLSVIQSANLRGQYDADTIIKATCESLIAGGTDTTSIMLVWALCLLLINRRVLKKAQEELDVRVGRERRVNESDINSLVYLQAIAKETLRLHPASPLGGFREFTEDINIRGYNVPKGTWLIVNLWKLHRDPRVWGEDAMEFRPERFLSGPHMNLDVKGQDFELIPFGAGRRICPGTSFGMHMLHLVLANVLQAFDLSTVSDEVVDMAETVGLTNNKAMPLNVLVVPRLTSSLY
ncbi:hypothetical protein MIMGU_mgv1a026908mg [Erythranthe guttata]|uniref:Flavonoid-6-hydroxylase n=1 Tax=Erythranthe guttata TaxID=4155 RepID=A0A022QB64_ERYGU|nr:hypothetical protein MIMGU_mgv1a026908mg [Erythranthe guttata]